jgi:hypothetical protein
VWLVSDKHPTERGDYLLARILGGDETGLGNELLNECWDGYPVERIRALLRSDIESAVKSGAFIASELAKLSRPLLRDIAPLINHRDTWVRGDAIDTVNLAATVDHGEIVARAIEHITDDDRSIRFSAFTLLAASTRERLEAGWRFIRDTDVKEALRTILDEETTVSSAEIDRRLVYGSRLVRLFGLVSAARISDRRAADLLAATEVADEEIRSFALREALRRRLISPSEFEQRGG